MSRELTPTEICEAAEALIKWFESQDINPYESVPVMAVAINCACISITKADCKDLTDAVERSKAASRLVLEVMQDMLEGKLKPTEKKDGR